jgi:hypothetical protein
MEDGWGDNSTHGSVCERYQYPGVSYATPASIKKSPKPGSTRFLGHFLRCRDLPKNLDIHSRASILSAGVAQKEIRVAFKEFLLDSMVDMVIEAV